MPVSTRVNSEFIISSSFPGRTVLSLGGRLDAGAYPGDVGAYWGDLLNEGVRAALSGDGDPSSSSGIKVRLGSGTILGP